MYQLRKSLIKKLSIPHAQRSGKAFGDGEYWPRIRGRVKAGVGKVFKLAKLLVSCNFPLDALVETKNETNEQFVGKFGEPLEPGVFRILAPRLVFIHI